jgi:hypothetical protein
MPPETTDPLHVRPDRLILSADVLLVHRDAVAKGGSDATHRAKVLLDQFTDAELIEAAAFVRRLGLGKGQP